jgi:hypothetical protein
MQIGFIGLGKLGLPCAEAVLKKGHNVSGYDVRLVDHTMVNICDTVQEVVQDKDIVFIAVPTPHDPEYDGRAPTAHLPSKDFNYDMVVGNRINKADSNDNRINVFRRGHRTGNFMFSKLSQILHPSGVSDSLSGFRVMSRNFIESFAGGASDFDEAFAGAFAAIGECAFFPGKRWILARNFPVLCLRNNIRNFRLCNNLLRRRKLNHH